MLWQELSWARVSSTHSQSPPGTLRHLAGVVRPRQAEEPPQAGVVEPLALVGRQRAAQVGVGTVTLTLANQRTQANWTAAESRLTCPSNRTCCSDGGLLREERETCLIQAWAV